MSLHEQAHVIGHDLQSHNPPAVRVGFRADQPLTAASENRTAILRAPHDVTPEAKHATSENLRFTGHAGDYTQRLCQAPRFLRLKAAIRSRGA